VRGRAVLARATRRQDGGSLKGRMAAHWGCTSSGDARHQGPCLPGAWSPEMWGMLHSPPSLSAVEDRRKAIQEERHISKERVGNSRRCGQVGLVGMSLWGLAT